MLRSFLVGFAPFVVVAFGLADGCASRLSGPAPSPSWNRGFVMPVLDSASTAPSTPRLEDAVPIATLETDGKTVTFTDKLGPPHVGRKMFFGGLDTQGDEGSDDVTATVPVFGVKSGDDWLVVPLHGPALTNAEWRYVGGGPGRHEIWGALETGVGDPSPDFVLAHSVDGGKTWSMANVRKPCKEATIFDFAMARGGHGRVTLWLDSDCSDTVKTGLYHYDTADGGKTWAAPTFEPDAMIRADSVDDDEQPDDAPARKALLRRDVSTPMPSR